MTDRTAEGLILHPSEREYWTRRVAAGPNMKPQTDPALDRPERPCACCGNLFQPTQKRRLLCHGCFRYG